MLGLTRLMAELQLLFSGLGLGVEGSCFLSLICKVLGLEI